MESALTETSFFGGEFYAFACAVVWSAAFILFRKSGEQVPPVVLNLFKNTLGLVLLLVTLLVMGIDFFPPEASTQDWALLLLSGLVGVAIADSLVFAALNRLGAGGQAIVDCLYSPLVILFAFFYLAEPLRPGLLVAVVLVVGAIFVGMSPEKPPNAGQASEKILGISLGAVAMVLMAASIVGVKPILAHTDAWWATTVRLFGAMPLLLVQGLSGRYRQATRRAFTPGPHWRFLLPGSLLGAYFALLLWLLGFQKTSAGVAGLLNQTSTIMIMLLATIFLKEKLTGRRVLGMLMGFAGAALVMF